MNVFITIKLHRNTGIFTQKRHLLGKHCNILHHNHHTRLSPEIFKTSRDPHRAELSVSGEHR